MISSSPALSCRCGLEDGFRKANAVANAGVRMREIGSLQARPLNRAPDPRLNVKDVYRATGVHNEARWWRSSVNGRDPGAWRDTSSCGIRGPMYALAISGSPRKKSNTETLLRRCLDVLGAQGIEGELISLREKTIKGCRACEACRRNQDRRCSIGDDDFHPVFEAIVKADIIIVGSPVYFGSAAP